MIIPLGRRIIYWYINLYHLFEFGKLVYMDSTILATNNNIDQLNVKIKRCFLGSNIYSILMILLIMNLKVYSKVSTQTWLLTLEESIIIFKHLNKKGSPIMHFQNLKSNAELCKDTRLICLDFMCNIV